MKVYDSQGRLKTIATGASMEPTSAQFSTLSAKVEVISNAVSIVSNAVSIVSQALSVETAARIAAVNTVSNAASNALSIANAASNAASIVSQALSVETAARVLAVDAVSTAASNALSVANAASNAASIVSAFVAGVSAKSVGGTSVKGLQSVVNTLSNRISAGGSVTSAEVQAVSAQAASAINVVSARVVSVSAELVSLVQIASAAATSADAHAGTASAAATSADAHANTASAAATSADTHANTASAAATSVDARVTSVNAFISGISARSVGGVSTHGLQSVVDALSNRISAGGGTGSVTSAELASVDARVTSVVAIQGNNYGALLTGTFVTSTVADIAGLSVQLFAGKYIAINAMFLVNAPTGQPYFMAWSAAGLGDGNGGFWRAAISVGVGGSINIITTQAVFAQFNDASPVMGATAFSCTRGGTAGITPVTFDAIFACSASNPLTFKIGTAAGQSIFVYPGSHVRAQVLSF